MSTASERRQDLYERHDQQGMANGERLQGEFFLRMADEIDQLDAEFAESWLRHVYGYMYGRQVLDDRTRVLVIIGQVIAAGDELQLPNHMRTALAVGATPREILEVILQSSIYGGHPRMAKALRIYRRLMESLGLEQFEPSPFRDDALDERPDDAARRVVQR